MALGSEKSVERESVTWEVGPTKDVIQAFMESLVDPRLPYTFSINDHPPSEDAQKTIARQMHAVVFLYNYYHRKQKLELEFMDFVSFCKLALSLRPILTPFMKMIHGSEVVEFNGVDDQLSVTEKAIKKACNIAKSLDASKDVPSIEGYPISKVVVLLIDSEKENCLLQFGAVTEGVWSLIEKEIDDECNINQEILAEERVCKKRKTNALADHSKFLKIGFDAVKDVTGIDVSDVEVLEAHVVYSLSKEKSAAQFYMMKCKHSFSKNEQFPLESLVASLQGPFANKYGDSWESTELFEYHCLLPYKELISSWLPRKDLSVPILSDYKDVSEVTPSRMPDSSLASYSIEEIDYINQDIPEKKTSSFNKVPDEDSKDSEKKRKHFSGGKVDKDREKHVKKGSLSGLSRGKSQGVGRDDNASRRRNTSSYQSSKNIASGQHDANGPEKGVNSKVETVDIFKSTHDHYKHERIAAENGGAAISSNQNAIAAEENVQVHFEEPYNAEGENIMPSEDLQNVLALLDKKRQRLYSRRCTMEDTLASYEHLIDRIRDGGEIGLARQCIKSIMSGSDPLVLKKESQVQGKAGEDPSNPQPDKKNLFSNIFLPGRSSCQDLEITCLKNTWTLPRYCVLPLDGKFLSNVIVCTGTSTTLTSKGASESTPVKARESAAAQMIAKIRALLIEPDQI